MKRILGILLMVLLLTSPFSSVYALETPQPPQAGDLTTNEEITNYNNKVEKYNEEVDKYNAEVDKEYNAQVENINQQNEAGTKAQEQSQQAHDEAVAQNEKAQADADAQNEVIDQQNAANQKEVEDWNAVEDGKVSASQQEIANINSQNEQGQKDVDEHNTKEDQKVTESQDAIAAAEQQNAEAIAAAKAHNDAELEKEAEYNATVEAVYQAALQAEAERIAQLEEENQNIEAANQAERDRVAAEEQANAEEEARVNAVNEAITARNKAALDAYEAAKTAAETNNTFVDNVDNKIEADASDSRGFTNNSTESVPTDWSDDTNESSLKTIQIQKSDNPVGEKIRVINLHLFLDESVPYSPDCYQSLIDDEEFELSDEMKERAILAEWETAEIDYEDSVTMSSEATNFAGNIVWLNGKRQWFGADPKPYFFRAIKGYTQGYWMPGGSMLATTATVQENEYTPGGETYTVQHAEETAYSSYLYNGQPMVEEITVRTTDRQEPKNIFTIFTYLFTRLAPEPEKQDLPEEPELEELETFVPKDIIPAVIQDLIEIIPNTITKGDPYEKDIWEPELVEVPELYTAQYQTFEPTPVPEEYTPEYKTYTAIEHVIPALVEIPDIMYWTALNLPDAPEHLAHLSLVDLLPEPEKPTPTPPTPIVTPTPTPTPGPTPVVIYEREDGDPVEEIQIADAETPTTIAAANIPRAKPKTEEDNWALINLICTILSCIIAAVLLFVKKKTDDEEEEYTDEEKKDIRGIRRFKIYSILVGIISVIAFILTEDMTLPIILIDKWTILMVILLLVNVINIFVMRNKSKEEDDDDDK